jgi:tetratricopeptide (TPR) repeat protein
MKRRLRNWWLIPAALVLVSAAPDPGAEDLVRRGNAAFDRGEYSEAARLYRLAEEHSSEPGLVAFNKATALYGQKEYDQAESHYWLCLGDAGPAVERWLQKHPDRDLPPALRHAAGPRLSRVLYNVGTCLLQRSDGKDADAVEQAVALYDHCLRLGDGGDTLRENARHNLELAKELLRLNPRPPKRDKSKNGQTEDDQPPKKKDQPGSESSQDGNPNKTRHGSQPTDEHADGKDDALATDERRPGKGNLGTLPDQDELTKMSAADAEQHLRDEVKRILGERRDYQQQPTRDASPHVKDW